jgi:integrase
MASLRQRGNKWQARVIRKGYPDEVRSFETKQDAQKWARSIESAMDRGAYQSPSIAKDIVFYDVLERYVQEVTPTKRGSKREAENIRFVQRQKIARHAMPFLTPAVIAAYRDERLKKVSAGTIIRELVILSSVFNHARREWGLPITNPCELVRKPPTPQGRTRTLSKEEEMRLLNELEPKGRRSRWMLPLVELAIETAMRRGELLSLKWVDVNLLAQTATLPLTKNGTLRVVPLSKKATAILENLPRNENGRVFQLTDMGMEAAFRKACSRAGIENLHFHDLRHTATSRLAAKLPNVIELAAVTGHKTIQMLKRYYHPIAEELAKKLG